jgi:alkylation response protein AidB-like acyl-CoA dehydrogenase
MDFRFTPEQEALRKEFDDFFREEMRNAPPEWGTSMEAMFGLDACWEFHKKMAKKLAAKGWLTRPWPKEYGGLDAPLIEQFIFSEVQGYHRGAGVDPWGIQMLAPTLLVSASDEQKHEHLPYIARAERFWTQLWSEPGAGSDLLNTATKAVKDGDYYVINGQKIWPTGAHLAEWCLLLARTDPNAPKSKGLSTFLVDVRWPGVTVNPIIDMAGAKSFNEIFLEDVRVHKKYLLGQENRGLPLVFEALEGDRFWGRCIRHAGSRKDVEELVEYVNEARYDGHRLKDNQVIRDALAEIAIEMQVSRMINYKAAWLLNQGKSISWESSVVKVFADELGQRLAHVGLEILGPEVQLGEDPKWTKLRKRFTFLYKFCRGLSLAGGTS